MRTRFLPVLPLLLTSYTVWGASHYRYINDPDADFYFGRISLCELQGDSEDPRVLREWRGRPETASVNLPLAPGDAVQTTATRRCEVQFDSGTIVRLDRDTELFIETILARSLTTRDQLTNLVLRRGEIYIMYRDYGRGEVFQVLTPSAAVKLRHGTVAVIGLTAGKGTEVKVKRGRAEVLYGSEGETRAKKVDSARRLTVGDEVELAPLLQNPADSEFEQWNASINENFEGLHRGESVLPKPVASSSPAVIDFAQKYASAYGEWIWSDLYGYVWRPYSNDSYPRGRWQPLRYGRWTDIRGELFWVPDEPWGWVPYHLGMWFWDNKVGWVWRSGSTFAPAWVAWDHCNGQLGWRPWSVWDWYGARDFYRFGGLFSGGSCFSPGRGVLYARYYVPRPAPPVQPTEPTEEPPGGGGEQPEPPEPPRPPKDIERIHKRLTAALEAGDERVRSSLEETSRQGVLIRGDELDSPRVQERVVRREALAEAPSEPASEAMRGPLRFHDAIEVPRASAGEEPPPGTAAGAEEAPVPSAISSRSAPDVRFLDWNRDVKAAMRIGGAITYSSRENEVECRNCDFRALRRASDFSEHGSHSGGSASSGSGGGDTGGGSAGSAGGGGARDHGGGARSEGRPIK